MKYLATLAVVCLPLFLFATPSPPIRFLEGNLPEARRMAAREGKLYFIHFAADWCMPCQWMEKHTFRDEVLSGYLEKYFLAVRADVDQQEGQALKEQFKVRILPTILVFNPQGQLLGRHEGAMEPEALLEQMQAYRYAANRMETAREEEILSSPQPVFAVSRPALIPDAAGGPAPVVPHSPGSSHYPANRAAFTIQAGVFSSYDNAIRHCAALESRVNHRTEIAPFQLNGQNMYKVFLGRFDSQAEAAAHLRELQRLHIDGFVKIMGY